MKISAPLPFRRLRIKRYAAVKAHEPKATMTIGIRNKNALGMGMSADSVFFWANWVGVIALAVGVVCACAIAISGKIRDDRLKLALAESSRKTADAELKLGQLRKLAGPRDINFDAFKKELEGKPKATVAIWYLPDSSDGYWFASRLMVALGISGWQVKGLGPTPIPEPDQNNLLVRDMPRAMAAGGQSMGVTVVGDAPMGTNPDQNADTPFNALFHALAKSTDFGMYGSSGSQFTPVPKGTLRVVVAAKADPMFADKPPQTASPKPSQK